MKEPKVIVHGLPRRGKDWHREQFIGNMGRTDHDDTLALHAEWAATPLLNWFERFVYRFTPWLGRIPSRK